MVIARVAIYFLRGSNQYALDVAIVRLIIGKVFDSKVETVTIIYC